MHLNSFGFDDSIPDIIAGAQKVCIQVEHRKILFAPPARGGRGWEENLVFKKTQTPCKVADLTALWGRGLGERVEGGGRTTAQRPQSKSVPD